MEVRIVSVNVGQPQVLRQLRTKTVYSSINKHPVVSSGELLLTYTNLLGDQQVDTRPKEDGRQLHGGNEKAIYVYPVVHYDLWRQELGLDLHIPSFGENLTIDGVDETVVRVGDVWRWGDALLEVSKPRQPCYKLSWHLGVSDIEVRMWDNARCGWYMRVLEPGIVPTQGGITVVSTQESAPSIAAVLGEKEKNNRS